MSVNSCKVNLLWTFIGKVSFFVAIPTPTVLLLHLLCCWFCCLVFLPFEKLPFFLNGGDCVDLKGLAFFFSFSPFHFFALNFFFGFGG